MLIHQRKRVRDGLLARLGELDESECAILQHHTDHINRFKRLPHHTPEYIAACDEFEGID